MAVVWTVSTFLGLVVTCLGVAVVCRWAERRQVLDVPNERSSHQRPTPRGGGLPIVVVLMLGWVVLAAVSDWNSRRDLLGLLLGGGLVALVSWTDDLRAVSPATRLSVHTLAALVLIAATGYWGAVRVPMLGDVDLDVLSLPVTLLWIVGLTNAYNFMDGIDGIAGGQAAVAGIGWSLLAFQQGDLLIALSGSLILGTALGFLRHNWSPASIFMGDVGSTFLGFTLAALAVVAQRRNAVDPIVGVVLVWPFVFDSGMTFVKRLLAGEPVFQAHRSHIYQRLVQSGKSHRRVAGIYIALAAAGVFASVAMALDIRAAALWPTLVLIGVPTVLLLQVWRAERRCRKLGASSAGAEPKVVG